MFVWRESPLGWVVLLCSPTTAQAKFLNKRHTGPHVLCSKPLPVCECVCVCHGHDFRDLGAILERSNMPTKKLVEDHTSPRIRSTCVGVLNLPSIPKSPRSVSKTSGLGIYARRMLGLSSRSSSREVPWQAGEAVSYWRSQHC